jgi:iron complex transport system substrate-binding protein
VRLVSLCPSLTDSVFGLGRGEHLVGRTKFCVQPKGLVDAIERVGGTKNPKIDRIAELAPDLVLMNEEENRKEDADALAQAGIRVLSTFARDVRGARDSLITLGRALHAVAAAKKLTKAIDARLAELRARTSDRRVRFAYLIWREPLMAVGPDTYVHSLLESAGGVNIVHGDRYPEIDLATLAAADKILLSSEPFPFADKHRQELIAATDLPADRFALVDGELLSWHGRKTLEGLAYAEAVLS